MGLYTDWTGLRRQTGACVSKGTCIPSVHAGCCTLSLPSNHRRRCGLHACLCIQGSAVFSVAKVDPTTGEIAGVFESIQPGDTDLGAKTPKDIKITGLWYGQLTQA